MVTVPLAAHADGIALGRLPAEVVEKAKLCVLEDSGHWMTFERASEVTRALSDFF